MILDAQRVLAVHAHPDDETLWTGLALAGAARRGADVAVVTCTLGEEGEIIGDELAGLDELLGGYRLAELQRALDALGVGEPLLLGGVGAWRDSGMAGSASIQHPRAFATGDMDVQVQQLVEVLRSSNPQVVLTYDPHGGYGHPDHIRAHQITHAAVEQLWREGTGPEVILWAANDRSAIRDAEYDLPEGWRTHTDAELENTSVEQVDFVVQAEPEDAQARRRAMVAHATQVMVAEQAYALSNFIAFPFLDTEAYRIGARREDA